MAAFTVTVAQNITALTGKTGGDTYAINGGALTIDTDSRYGLNQTTSASLAAITISATLGGTVDIDARFVRMIAFTGGTGTVPAADTAISQGGASSKLIAVYSALNAAPLAAAAAMPATGFIKVRQWNSAAYAAGALTGISATSSGVDVAGWIELVGDEAATVTVPRLGLYRMRGEWFDLGAASGVNSTTYQLPTNGSIFYCPGVWVETAIAGTYEFYPCAGSLVAVSSVATDVVRGKVCWISTAGLLRFGSDGTNANGYIPPAGRKIRVPNIFTANCTTAARTANALPNATLATRYDFTTTGGGAIEIDRANLCWYPSFAQAFSVNLSNTGICEQVSISEIASPLTWSNVGVGQCAAQSQFALLMSLCLAGGSMTNCTWSRANLSAAGNYVASITDCSGFTMTGNKFWSFLLRANATTGAQTLTRVRNFTYDSPTINGRLLMTTCFGISIANTTYFDNAAIATGTVNPMYAFSVGSACDSITISGLDFGGLNNVNPYNGVLNVTAANCSKINLRNIGTRGSPLNLQAVNGGAFLSVLDAGAAANDVKHQRCYVSNTRSGLWSTDNSSSNIVFENCAGDFADAPVTPHLNGIARAIGCTKSLIAQTACYGSHFADFFNSATTGAVAILCNEKTSVEPSASSYAVIAGAPKFTSAGGLFMPTVGDAIEFTLPYYALGHTGFQNLAATMAGGTIGNYTLQYRIDKNNGAGYGALTALTGANLSAETGISAALGFKLQVRITTAIANLTAITALSMLTTTTTTAQDNQYPLDTNTVTFTGLQVGSDVVILQAGTTTVLAQADSLAGATYQFTYSGAQLVDVGFLKNGFVPLYIRGLSLTTTNSSIPVAQVADRNFS